MRTECLNVAERVATIWPFLLTVSVDCSPMYQVDSDVSFWQRICNSQRACQVDQVLTNRNRMSSIAKIYVSAIVVIGAAVTVSRVSPLGIAGSRPLRLLPGAWPSWPRA